jgi:hypothetical protein
VSETVNGESATTSSAEDEFVDGWAPFDCTTAAKMAADTTETRKKAIEVVGRGDKECTSPRDDKRRNAPHEQWAAWAGPNLVYTLQGERHAKGAMSACSRKAKANRP